MYVCCVSSGTSDCRRTGPKVPYFRVKSQFLLFVSSSVPSISIIGPHTRNTLFVLLLSCFSGRRAGRFDPESAVTLTYSLPRTPSTLRPTSCNRQRLDVDRQYSWESPHITAGVVGTMARNQFRDLELDALDLRHSGKTLTSTDYELCTIRFDVKKVSIHFPFFIFCLRFNITRVLLLHIVPPLKHSPSLNNKRISLTSY